MIDQHNLDRTTLVNIAHETRLDPARFRLTTAPAESGSWLAFEATDEEMRAFCDAADRILAQLAAEEGEGLLVLSDHLRAPRVSPSGRAEYRSFEWPLVSVPNME